MLRSLFFFFFLLFSSVQVCLFSHCEIPCGIYHDHLRIHLIEEHIETIEKSMKILSNDRSQNLQQFVRWVDNKEKHAQKIQDIVAHYFLHQRIKPVPLSNKKEWKRYHKHLEILHKILVHSMKAKQTMDLYHVQQLKILLKSFAKSYFHK